MSTWGTDALFQLKEMSVFMSEPETLFVGLLNNYYESNTEKKVTRDAYFLSSRRASNLQFDFTTL